MNETVEELLKTLKEELSLQRALVDLGKKKRDGLVAVDTAIVDSVTRREQQILFALGSTATRRIRLTSEAGGTGVRDLATRCGEPQATQLRVAAEDLQSAMNDLRKITSSCRALAEESLGYVRRFFDIVATAGQEQAGYTPRGSVATVTPARLMIDEVV